MSSSLFLPFILVLSESLFPSLKVLASGFLSLTLISVFVVFILVFSMNYSGFDGCSRFKLVL